MAKRCEWMENKEIDALLKKIKPKVTEEEYAQIRWLAKIAKEENNALDRMDLLGDQVE